MMDRMSDLITHWAVFEDARRIWLAGGRHHPDFLDALERQTEVARLGAITRAGHEWIPALLARYRPVSRSPNHDRQNVIRKLAFALGGIAHYAADVVLKPLMSRVARSDWSAAHTAMQRDPAQAATRPDKVSVREVSAYYDCHVFREVFQGQPGSPLAPAGCLFATLDRPGTELETFVRALFQRALLSCHTLSPPTGDFEPWIDRLISLIQPLYVGIDLYVRVYTSPDPEKMARYEVTTTFYRADDPVVHLARALRRGEQPTLTDFDAVLAEGANSGAYGRAVALAVRRFGEAADYWVGRVDVPPAVRQ